MKTSLKSVLLSILLSLSFFFTQAQLRTKHAKYLEFSGGFPLIFDGDHTLQYWKNGERVYGIGLCFTNSKANYHRIHIDFREEKVLDSPASYTNIQAKYSYESTLLKGKYHRSFLGLFYGGGLGLETLHDSPNLNLATEKTYPLLMVGLNFEKSILSPLAFLTRLEVDATTASISQSIKATLQIGLKLNIANGN